MARKIKRYKVGLNSHTYKISMVTDAAIAVDYVAMSKQEDERKIKLSSDERKICYGPVLIPEVDVYRNNGKDEYFINFSSDSILKMSQEFMQFNRQHEVNLQHQDDVDDVFVTESWIVEDSYRDKSSALGFNLPVGTWVIAMKVNNDEVWDKVKSSELRGFSVESLVSLEEFNNHTNLDNMEIETNEMFWTKLKNLMSDIITKVSLKKEEDVDTEDSEATKVEHLEEETPTAEEPNEATVTPSEPQNEEEQTPTKEEENKAAEEPQSEEKKEEPKDNHIEELVNNLKAEINALKELNKDLTNKVKDLGRAPSTKPKNVNATPKKEDTFAQWRAFAAKIDY